MRPAASVALASLILLPAIGAAAELTLQIKDVVAMPITGKVDGTGQVDGMLSRVNAVREEPGGGRRVFVVDMNGPLYILDKETKQFIIYLDFNGRDERPGLFDKLMYETGYSSGVSQITFDPDYRRNGKFYTVHMENPALPGSILPDPKNLPGWQAPLFGYAPSAAIATPGPVLLESVLIEWTDSNISNTTFEGTARELMRVQLNTRIHPMGEPTFNPTARRGDVDWRVMYIGHGDSGAGESRTVIRPNPQRLDTLVGKILRIIPDLTEHTKTSTVSENGRYRIPNDNPYAATAGARKEIWAYGLRNPHRLSWSPEARNPRLIAASIGLRTWETINIIRKGANYGYPQREGTQVLNPDNTLAALPAIDKIAVQIGEAVTDEVVVPTYPAAQYGHVTGGGDAIGSGYVYNGKEVPVLRGKYVFTDLTTGRLWYVEYKDLVAADDGEPTTLAPIHEMKVVLDGQTHDTFFSLTQAAYKARGGEDPDLPGRGAVSGPGRADARFALDAGGELYIYSKSDGMIRRVVGAK